MKKKIVFAVFAAAAVLAVILRLYQMLALTEYETGFIERENYSLYIVLAAIIALLVLGAPIFALMSAPTPKKSQSYNIVLSLSEILLAGASLLDALFVYSSENDVPQFLKIACLALGALCAAYFAAAGVRSVIYFPFSSKLAAIPPAFFTVRAACVFISCSRHAVVSDTVFEVFIYCACMLLFLEIARAANGAGGKLSVRKITFFGLAAALLSFGFSLPKVALGMFYSSALHDSARGAVLTLALGLYSAALVFSRLNFSGKSERMLGVYYQGRH